MAEKIVKDQSKEIKELQSFCANKYVDEEEKLTGHP